MEKLFIEFILKPLEKSPSKEEDYANKIILITGDNDIPFSASSTTTTKWKGVYLMSMTQ
jgi:hypothetical protein